MDHTTFGLPEVPVLGTHGIEQLHNLQKKRISISVHFSDRDSVRSHLIRIALARAAGDHLLLKGDLQMGRAASLKVVLQKAFIHIVALADLDAGND